MPEYILTAEHLKKVFRGREKYGKKGKDICAVEDVSFSLRKGESLGKGKGIPGRTEDAETG